MNEKKAVFIAAEISANHGQDLNRAKKLIKEAKKCGADAVKFQTYTPDTLTLNVDNKYFRIRHPRWGRQTLYALYKKAYTPWKWFEELKKIADDQGIVFFSTAFDRSSVDFLESLKVPYHKIASFELVDLPLIEYAARTKKPLILSTGMATLEEIKDAVAVARKAGAREITLLKCVSSYPAKPSEMHLKTIPDMRKRFKLSVGLSDHTPGTSVAIASVALGATFVEKHFKLSPNDKTPDSFFSIVPGELRELVRGIRSVEDAMGRVHYGLTRDQEMSRVFRRSLFVARDIRAGEIFSEENIRSIRPHHGLAPKYLRSVLGKKAKIFLEKGTPLFWKAVG